MPVLFTLSFASVPGLVTSRAPIKLILELQGVPPPAPSGEVDTSGWPGVHFVLATSRSVQQYRRGPSATGWYPINPRSDTWAAASEHRATERAGGGGVP